MMDKGGNSWNWGIRKKFFKGMLLKVCKINAIKGVLWKVNMLRDTQA